MPLGWLLPGTGMSADSCVDYGLPPG